MSSPAPEISITAAPPLPPDSQPSKAKGEDEDDDNGVAMLAPSSGPVLTGNPQSTVSFMSDAVIDMDDREQWGSNLQFFFTILGFCVGLGNIWRFPYLCQAYGGGAFVIPFLVMVVVEGMPLLLLELAVGQRFRRGSYVVWNLIHPWLGGLGLGSSIIGFGIGCYYTIIITWCLYYLVISIRPTLPWSTCPINETRTAEVYANSTEVYYVDECEKSSESQYFWYRQALDVSGSIDELGGLRWWLFISLTASWGVVYIVIRKGIKSSGKVVYFTALFPYFVLTIFFVRGLMLKGSFNGILHMLKPDMEMLFSPTVWLEAATQVFYSFSLAFGSIIGFGSYNPVDKNCVRDTYIISLANALTAVYACGVVFAILGFKAQHLFERCMKHDMLLLKSLGMDVPTDVSDMSEEAYRDILDALDPSVEGLRNCSLAAELNDAAQGTGLAFIIMPEVFSALPGAPFWSFLFFAMLLALGLGSQIGLLEGVLGTLFDMPQLKNQRRVVLSGICCLSSYIVGLLFITAAGEYWITLADRYLGMGLSLIALCEVLAVMYVYGHERFTRDVEEMTGVRPGPYWQITWRFVSPILITVILASSVVQEMLKWPTYHAWQEHLAKSVPVKYPWWCLVIAVFLALASIIAIAIIALLRMAGVSVLDIKEDQVGLRRVDTDASCGGPIMRVDSYHDEPPRS